MNITAHAVQRYQERVEAVPKSEVIARLRAHEAAVDVAHKFRCGTVLCGDGIRLKLKGRTVATVIGRRG